MKQAHFDVRLDHDALNKMKKSKNICAILEKGKIWTKSKRK